MRTLSFSIKGYSQIIYQNIDPDSTVSIRSTFTISPSNIPINSFVLGRHPLSEVIEVTSKNGHKSEFKLFSPFDKIDLIDFSYMSHVPEISFADQNFSEKLSK